MRSWDLIDILVRKALWHAEEFSFEREEGEHKSELSVTSTESSLNRSIYLVAFISPPDGKGM